MPMATQALDLNRKLARRPQCSRATAGHLNKSTSFDKQEGKPHGVLHDVEEALGIGYGVKRPSYAELAGL